MIPQPSKWLVFDLETTAREDVTGLLPEPVADGRLKDPEKIAADKTEKRAQTIQRLPVDVNGCRIFCLGLQTEVGDRPVVYDGDERFLLETFQSHARGRTLIGYCSRTFDLPVILQRSRYLGVPIPPWRDLLAPYGRSKRHIDLFDELTFDNGRNDGVVPRKLTTFCRLFDLDVPDDDSTGADVAALIAAGDLEAVRHHCETDVTKTVALARALGVLPSVFADAASF